MCATSVRIVTICTCIRVHVYTHVRTPVNKLMSRLQAKELKDADLLELGHPQKDRSVPFAWLFNLSTCVP